MFIEGNYDVRHAIYRPQECRIGFASASVCTGNALSIRIMVSSNAALIIAFTSLSARRAHASLAIVSDFGHCKYLLKVKQKHH